MTALSDAYAGTVAAQRGRHRLYLGVGLFSLGAVLVVAGIVAAGSGLLTARGYSLGEARWLAGILGGIGVPAVFLVVFTILPATRTTRGTALIGASVAMFGVALFAHAYPCQWIGNTCATGGPNLTLPTAGVYFAGTLTTFWCLFSAVATFKTRNDPGGTVTMEIRKMTAAQPEDSDDSEGFGGLGGVGLFGSEPEGDVATQTNAAGPASPAGAATTSDGGATSQQLSTPNGSSTTQPGSTANASTTTNTQSTTPNTGSSPSTTQPASESPAADSGVDKVSPKSSRRSGGSQSTDSSQPQTGGNQSRTSSQSRSAGDSNIDRYCGSCAQFKYVRTDNGIQPYCAHHDELMDDMESCESWEPRS